MQKIAQSIIEFVDNNVPNKSDSIAETNILIKKIEHFPESRGLLLNKNNKIIGYWSFVPLFNKYFEKSKNGKLNSNDITPEIIPILIPGRYNIEFGATILDEEYSEPYTYGLLIHSIIEYLQELALGDVFIDEIIIKTCTNSGTALAKGLGLKYYKKNVNNSSDIYHTFFMDLFEQNYFNNFVLLKELYCKEYN